MRVGDTQRVAVLTFWEVLLDSCVVLRPHLVIHVRQRGRIGLPAMPVEALTTDACECKKMSSVYIHIDDVSISPRHSPLTWLLVTLRWNSLQIESKGLRISRMARLNLCTSPFLHLLLSLLKVPVLSSSNPCVWGCTLTTLTR